MIDALLLLVLGAPASYAAAFLYGRRLQRLERARELAALPGKIERLERALFPEWFPPKPVRVAASNFTQIHRQAFDHRRAVEAAAFGFEPGAIWPVHEPTHITPLPGVWTVVDDDGDGRYRVVDVN